ncbi:hypothetical protein OSTOST_00041 [Ostertagia ostertagi]
MLVAMKVILLVQVLCFITLAAKTPVASKKSKLCGNEKCDEILFKAKVKRVMDSTHEAFLSLKEGVVIDVTAVKFSDRTDLMEGVLADGTRGNFYIGAIDIGSYIEFLRDAIHQKKELKEVSQTRDDLGSKKLLGTVRADLHLVRDYNVQARRYAEEQNLPEPELFPLPEEAHNNHGHSHSHGSGHGAHPHYVGHLHSHEHTAQLHGSKGSPTEHVDDATVVTVPPPPTKPAASEQPQPMGVNPVTSEPAGSIGVNPVVSEPAGSMNVKPVASDPTGSMNLKPVAPEVTGSMGVNPVVSESVGSMGVKPVTPEASGSVGVNPVVTESAGSMGVKPVTPEVSGSMGVNPVASDPAGSIGVNLVKEDIALPTADNQSQTHIEGMPLNAGNVTDTPVLERLSTADVIASTAKAMNLKPESGDFSSSGSRSLEPETQHVGTVDPSTTPPVVPMDSVEKLGLAELTKPKEPHNTADTQEGSVYLIGGVYHEVEAIPDKVPLTLQPSTTLSPSDFDVRVPVTEAPANPPEDVDKFCLREKCPNDGDPVPLEGIPRTDEGQRDMSVSNEPKQEAMHASGSENSSSTVREVLKSLTGAIRIVSFMDSVDDAGIGFVINLSLLFAAVVFHFISYFLPDFNGSVVCNSMITHDLGTKCKLLDELNRSKDLEINRLASAAGRSQGNMDEAAELRKELCAKEAKIQSCLQTCENQKSELEEERRLREVVENKLEFERKRAIQAEEGSEEMRRRLLDSEQAHFRAMNELTSARLTMEALERELRAEKQLNEEAAADLKKANDIEQKLRMDLQFANEEIKKLASEKSNMELENATLSSMIEEAERIRKEGSGGSGGWSDFGDDIVEPVDEERERTPTSAKVAAPLSTLPPTPDIRELTKIRIQLRKTEHELEAARVALEYEKEERNRADSKLTSLQNELDRRTREVEERDRDRSRADERCNELLALVKDSNTKVKETEQLRDKLWDDIAILQNELAARAEDRRKKDEKISDLEFELKRMRNEHLKLETRRFNEVLELKHKLDMIQTSQMQPIPSPTHGYDFLTNLERNAAPSPTSLWEEPPRPMSSNRTSTPEEGLLYNAFPTHAKKTSTRARKSTRAQLSNSPSDREKRKESSHRRVRSRSHGRLLWDGRSSDTSLQYGPMDHTYPRSFLPSTEYEMETTGHHRNKVVHVCHSSGGSNAGRSPPPEMPLLSAVPPPGLQKPAGKRIIDPGLDAKP